MISAKIQTDRQTRNTYLDIVKYFTIFCVLWGHVVKETCMYDDPNSDHIFRLIYSFHMPLFMMICGYFFQKSIAKYGRYTYIKRKLKLRCFSLIIPMLSFGALKMVISGNIGIVSWLENSHRIWFLGDLVINTLLVIYVLKWCNNVFFMMQYVFFLYFL